MSDIELFIMCIQERPILWDKRNKNYHNRLLSHREWEKLAEINETTSEALKKKWKNLRDTFTRELKKIPKPRSGTDADNEPKYTGTWPYFENMSFLTVVLKPRKTYGNIEQDDDITECDSIDLQERTGDVNVEDISGMDMADNNNTQLSISILQDANFTVMHPHSPSAPTPSPSAPTPSPSAPTPSPSAPIPSPSAPIPSPSAPPSFFRTFQEPSPTPAAKKKATKRKRQDDDLQAYMELEREKLKLLREDQQDANDDDLLWFKSILPYMKQLPQMNKLLFRTQMQEHLLNELTKLNNAPQPGQSGYYTSL